MSNWIDEELTALDLGDKRLNERSKSIISHFQNNPHSSINGSFRGWQESKAAYRFFDNDQVSSEKILFPHNQKTASRMASSDIILCVQDTTIIDYSHRQKEVSGLGKLRLPDEQGLFLHPTLAFSEDGVCLGVLDHKTWIRTTFQGKQARQAVKSVACKESMRWIESYRKTASLAMEHPDKLFINIADREGDFYEFLQEYDGKKNKAHIIVRAKSNRILSCSDNEPVSKLWDKLKQQPVIGQVNFTLSAIAGQRKAREVHQKLRSCQVSFASPEKVKQLNKSSALTVSAVLCSEEDPPIGTKAIEWLLLTTLDLQSDLSKVLDVVKYYQLRWQIELYFKILKSGCGIEKLQLAHRNRLENCIAIYMIIAWRILFLTYINRADPELNCSLFYEESEWKAVYIMAYKKEPPSTPPSIDQMNRIIASFGGFLNRKHDGPPGIKTMWIGLQRLRDFTIAFETFNALKTYG